MGKYIIPGFICIIIISCLKNKVPVYNTVISGADDGLKTVLKIVPTMIVILTAVSMFRASGALDYVVRLMSPLFEKMNIPSELIPMIVLRPISGSGAMGLLTDSFSAYGPDSRIGMISGVIMGSTETTFYTMAVYFGAVGIKDVKKVLPCALIGDAVCVIVACLLIK